MIPLAPFVALWALQQGVPQKPAPDKVMATVDGTPVTAADVEPYLWDWHARKVVDELVEFKIVTQEAAKQNIVVTEPELDERLAKGLEEIKKRMPAGQDLDSFINGQFGGRSRLRLVAQKALYLEKMAERDFRPTDYVKVSTLLFRVNGATTDELSRAIKQADAAYAALNAGKSWDAVFRLYEKDEQVIPTGGAIGWKAMSAFPESLRAVFATLKVLGYSKPTQTQNGIQIFRLEARGNTAKPEELADLKAQYASGAGQAILARLRQVAKIEYKP